MLHATPAPWNIRPAIVSLRCSILARWRSSGRRAGIAGAVVLTSGYSQTGADGARTQRELVVLKAGSSEVAANVAKAHTGSLVGDDRVFTAACRKLNIMRVTSLEDLVITAGLLAQTGPLRAGGAGIASISGGACTLIADQAEASGLQCARNPLRTDTHPGRSSAMRPPLRRTCRTEDCIP